MKLVKRDMTNEQKEIEVEKRKTLKGRMGRFSGTRRTRTMHRQKSGQD